MLCLCTSDDASSETPSTTTTKPDAPFIIFTDSILRVWYRSNRDYPQPKTTVFLHVYSPSIFVSSQSYVLTQLLLSLIQSSFASQNYMAVLGGYTYTLTLTHSGVELVMNGYTEHMNNYLVNFMSHFVHPRYDTTA